jgi:hypothetical protein
VPRWHTKKSETYLECWFRQKINICRNDLRFYNLTFCIDYSVSRFWSLSRPIEKWFSFVNFASHLISANSISTDNASLYHSSCCCAIWLWTNIQISFFSTQIKLFSQQQNMQKVRRGHCTLDTWWALFSLKALSRKFVFYFNTHFCASDLDLLMHKFIIHSTNNHPEKNE